MELRIFTEPQQGATYEQLLTVAQTAEKLGYGSGGNQLLSSRGNLMAWLDVAELDKSVLKPVYSRFASRTLISPTVEQVLSINPTQEFPWLAQKKALGQEYCIYNIASDGKHVATLQHELARWRRKRSRRSHHHARSRNGCDQSHRPPRRRPG